jgi:hypothetical protein
MIMDAILKVSAAQAVAASAVSTNAIDLSVAGVAGFGTGTAPPRELETGEPLGFAVNVNVAASLTSCTFEIINTTDAALTAGLISLVTVSKLQADLPAGALFFVPLPNAPSTAALLRFLGMRYVPTGGAATVTVSAWFTSHAAFSALLGGVPKAYAKAFTS